MNPSLSDTPALSRRGLLKFSLGASAFLATAGLGASLTGCSSGAPQSGFAALRSGDLLFLRALLPVMLDGAVTAERMPAAVDGTLKSLDYNLDHLSPQMLKLTRQLFDVLGMAVTRGPLTGIWGSWENASADDIRHFLDRWENSSLNLLRMGHSSLLQLVM
ncbi:twin-arginine translocation pathway signal protein, partial [Pseudomonas sp. Sample_24]|uniref:twin-arginine translocation pathway signal protein n=2 Tax=unclassified Pseudomonas TaxID=196821 RepID=UPI001032F5F6